MEYISVFVGVYYYDNNLRCRCCVVVTDAWVRLTWFSTDEMTFYGVTLAVIKITTVLALVRPRLAMVFSAIVAIISIDTLGDTPAILVILVTIWFIAVAALIKVFKVNYLFALCHAVVVTGYIVAKLNLLYSIVLVIVAVVILYALRPTEYPERFVWVDTD